MKRQFLALFLIFAGAFTGFCQDVMEPELQEVVANMRNNEKTSVNIIMKTRRDASISKQASLISDRKERRDFVVSELKAFAAACQSDLVRTLDDFEKNGMAENIKSHWLGNYINVSLTKDAIYDVAQRSDVLVIGCDRQHYMLFDEESKPVEPTREITQNVYQVKADQVWAEGYTGDGVVVAVIDTGVNYNHVDIADHLWDGGEEFPHHGYDVFNNDNDPMDDMGHGSHCAGTVCGDGTAGKQTGMAPDATLMCVKCLDANGSGGAVSIAAGIEWAVEHGCDLFSMSLGIPNSTIAERTLLRHACDDALEAGVMGAIAAGNEGDQTWMYQIPNNVRVPGSCPPPWLHPDQEENPGELSCSICIGAVDGSDNAAYFTSKGPVTWTNTEFGDYPYNPGIGLIRPDVCAPGVNIVSLNYQTNNGYTSMSGTSMATPCAAGVMSLLLSKNINITPAEMCQLLQETALPLSETKSNIYGSGRIDALEALENVSSGGVKCTFTEVVSLGNFDGKLNPGEDAVVNLAIANVGEDAIDSIALILSTDDELVAITDSVAFIERLELGDTLTLSEAFSFSVSEEAEAFHKINLAIEIYVGGEYRSVSRLKADIYDYMLAYGSARVRNDDNGNGILEPGETADLRVTLKNIGNEMTFGVNGLLSSEYEFVTINEAEGAFGIIGGNMMGFADFNVTLSEDAPEDFEIPFVVDVTNSTDDEMQFDFIYENVCNVIFELHDSYGDGWGSAYLTVSFDDGTESINMTIENGGSEVYTVEVASGTTVTLTWHNAMWSSECSFIVKYENGEIIYEQNGAMSAPYSWQNNCAGCLAPELCNPIEDLTAEVSESLVSLSWEEPEEGTPAMYQVYKNTLLLAETEELSYTDTVFVEDTFIYSVYPVYEECQGTWESIVVEIDLDVNEISLNEAAKLYPNPSKDEFIVECQGMKRVTVYGMHGEIVVDAVVDANRWQLSGLESGVYFVKIETTAGTIVKKAIKM